MEMEMPQEEMAFTEWSQKLEGGASHWLPAYGFQQPSQLHEALLQHEYINNDNISQSNYVYLETIVEETSDDLRSESDYSDTGGGWPDTDSDAGSVIHVPNLAQQNLNSGDWSGSERDLAVPKKRRRRLFNNDPGVQDDEDEEDERKDFPLPPFTNRSSSLLQFEALEKQCDTVFRASASSEQFVHSPSLTSSFSFDSLETSRWRFSGSPDSLDEASSLSSSCSSSSEIVSSDEELARSFSSRSFSDSYRSSLKSHRSYDSLIMCQEKQEVLSGEFSQSLNNNAIVVKEEEVENVPQRGLYKTVECLTEPTLKKNMEKQEPEKKAEKTRGQRSVENLSEDSGFGEHIPRGGSLRRASSSGVFTIAENEDDSSSYGSDHASEVKIHGGEAGEGGGWSDVGPNFSGWQSAPDLSEGAQSECDHRENKSDLKTVLTDTRPITSTTSLLTFTIKDEDEFLIIPEKKDFEKKMNSKLPVVSTPNLHVEEYVLDDNEVELTFPGQKKTALTRAQSFKEGFKSEKRNLRKTRSKGSNIQITTSFINLSTTPQSGSRRSVNCVYSTSFINLTNTHGGSNKGVHFSPEVQWRESSLEDWSDEVNLDGPMEEKEEVKEAKEPVRQARGGEGLPPLPPSPPSRPQQKQNTVVSRAPMESHPQKHKTGIGGFFQRFSFRRLSGREKKRKELKKDPAARPPLPPPSPPSNAREDVQIIPLHPPPEDGKSARPPPAPRTPTGVVPAGGGRKREGTPRQPGGGSVMSSGPKVGLLETDLDSDTAGCNKKARSLLNLGEGRTHLVPCPQPDQPADHRAKSMEFLLDKENQFAIKPPENELQKVGERVMSEHELRVQRSLQKLNIPDWYKNSQVPSQGFLLKRHSEGGGTGWQGLSSKTTSLSSLGSMQAATPRSPTGNLLSPSPTPSTHTFSRWSTSRLNSNPTSTSTSPCGSARSSFNYRQPYLGWRSQERLTNPRTPAERLAAGILSQKQQQQNVPNLSEVHTSIKEVTSAINNYIHGNRVDDRLSPAMLRHDNASSRSASPRGSTGRLCWLESSFVGNKPIDVPETPVSLTATPDHTSKGSDLYLDLSTPHRLKTTVNGIEYEIPGVSISGTAEMELRNKPSPGSTTMEDVLDSLLGLAPASRSPSPSIAHRSCSDLTNHLAGSASNELDPTQYTGEMRRHSEGCDSMGQPLSRCSRRVSFDMAIAEGEMVRCRYNKCNKTAPLAEAKRTFKTCHNCTHVYCSRECRRAHWEKHRKTCLHSRVGALCRKVMSNIKEDDETLQHISIIARRGYLAKGRGAVKVLFSRPKNAEDFIGEGYDRLGEPGYVKWADLQPDETGKEMHDELIRLCKTYNPDTRFVLYVAVCVVSEVPSSGAAVKWETQLVSRCAKLKLSSSLGQFNTDAPSEPETLILTSLPIPRDQDNRKTRQISFTNIQRHLRQKGISLRRQFPEVYQRLCSYVEGTSERFVPITIYPRDAATGKNFMCIIMPDAEPEKLQLIPTDSAHVQTIDISADPDSEKE